MPWGMRDSKEMAFYMALAQVGLDFVAPLILGAILDLWLGWSPWGVVVGAILGFVGGITHLVILGNRQPPSDEPKPGGDAPP